MDWIPRTTAVATMIALVFQCSLPILAANGATVEGTVEIPCDPSRVSEVASVQIRPVSGGSVTTLAVDPSTGTFLGEELTPGEYDLFTIGADGAPLSSEPKRLLLRDGSNPVTLSFQPPGCGEPDSDGDGVSDADDLCPNSPAGTTVGTDGCPLEGDKKPGKKDGLEDWQLTLIYTGVVGAAILILDPDDDDGDPVSEF